MSSEAAGIIARAASSNESSSILRRSLVSSSSRSVRILLRKSRLRWELSRSAFYSSSLFSSSGRAPTLFPSASTQSKFVSTFS